MENKNYYEILALESKLGETARKELIQEKLGLRFKLDIAKQEYKFNSSLAKLKSMIARWNLMVKA